MKDKSGKDLISKAKLDELKERFVKNVVTNENTINCK